MLVLIFKRHIIVFIYIPDSFAESNHGVPREQCGPLILPSSPMACEVNFICSPHVPSADKGPVPFTIILHVYRSSRDHHDISATGSDPLEFRNKRPLPYGGTGYS